MAIVGLAILQLNQLNTQKKSSAVHSVLYCILYIQYCIKLLMHTIHSVLYYILYIQYCIVYYTFSTVLMHTIHSVLYYILYIQCCIVYYKL